MIKIIRGDKDWNAQLVSFKNKDFYHTYYYHCLSKKEGETPVLITYIQDKVTIAIPLLIRAIKNSDYKDAVSVYGYCGVLSSNLNEDFDITDKMVFKSNQSIFQCNVRPGKDMLDLKNKN